MGWGEWKNGPDHEEEEASGTRERWCLGSVEGEELWRVVVVVGGGDLSGAESSARVSAPAKPLKS